MSRRRLPGKTFGLRMTKSPLFVIISIALVELFVVYNFT